MISINRKIFAAILAVLIFSVGAAWADDDDRRYSNSWMEGRNIGVYDAPKSGSVMVKEIDDVREGYPVSLRGVLVLAAGDNSTHKLTDDTGSIRVLVPAGKSIMPGSPGSVVDLHGTVDRNASDGSAVIVAKHVYLHDDSDK